MSVTILGQPIRLIRPEKIHKHSAKNAWSKPVPKKSLNKTFKLMFREKTFQAARMGFRYTGE
jgi:hypothetical protein